MSQVRHLTVIFPGRRSHPESRITASFTPVGGNSYRLDEGFLCGPIYFGDVIEAKPTEQEDILIFRRRVEKAGMKRHCYVMGLGMADRPAFVGLMRKIKELGGFSAVDFGGLFIVFLPKTSDLDVSSELDAVQGISRSKRRYLNWIWGLKRHWKKANEWLTGFY